MVWAHLDLWLFLATVAALFLAGIPAVRATVTVPVDMDVEEVPAAELTEAQDRFLAEHDRDLGSAGYTAATTFRVKNLGNPNLSRLYLDDRSSGIALASTLTSLQGEPMGQSYCELVQDLDDGSQVTTRNSTVSPVLVPIPGDVVQERPKLRRVADLKAAHDARLAGMRKRPSPRLPAAEVMARARARHRRWCAHQAAVGLLRLDEAAGVYRATTRTALRGIANFLNPFADDFRAGRFAGAALVAAGAPLLGSAAAGAIFPPAPAWPLEVALALPAFALAGAVVGALFQGKHFLWCFLLGYLPARTVGGMGFESLLYFLAMAETARQVARWRATRQILV